MVEGRIISSPDNKDVISFERSRVSHSVPTINFNPEFQVLVEDVTNNTQRAEMARRSIAEAYSVLTDTISVDEVYEQLCQDEYQRAKRARIFVATLNNPTKRKILYAGTVRLVLGEEGSNLPSIEAMKLMDAKFPHRISGVSDSQIAELGRFTIDPEISETQDLLPYKSLITASLYAEARQFAKRKGRNYLYAIMPRYMVRLTQQAHIVSTPVEGATMRPTEENLKLQEKFARYWKKHNPGLYIFLS